MQVKIKRVENGKLPEYKTLGSVGADCYARLNDDVTIEAGKNAKIPLGFSVEIPEGYEMQIRGRSGLASTLQVVGFTGTIDEDYRGEVCAILFNNSNRLFVIKNGDRIAQAVISPIIKAEWIEVSELSETERGTGGFGSTGISEIKVSYPHKIQKFYEPFTNAEKAKEFIGRKVMIGNEEYVVQKIELCKCSFGKSIVFYFTNQNTLKTENMYATQAFQMVQIDGHGFGQEMEIEK